MVLDKILAYCVLSKKKKFSNRYTVRGFTPIWHTRGTHAGQGRYQEHQGPPGSTRGCSGSVGAVEQGQGWAREDRGLTKLGKCVILAIVNG